MSQDNLIKLVSEGDEKGRGKGHIIHAFKNKRIKEPLRLKKHNPEAGEAGKGAHTWYKEVRK